MTWRIAFGLILWLSVVATAGPAAAREEILSFVRSDGESVYHPVGTCKMGQDDMAVVDERLRVRGVEGLRVADASIMPNITSGNTHGPAVMIAEKCADMLLQDAGVQIEAFADANGHTRDIYS